MTWWEQYLEDLLVSIGCLVRWHSFRTIYTGKYPGRRRECVGCGQKQFLAYHEGLDHAWVNVGKWEE